MKFVRIDIDHEGMYYTMVVPLNEHQFIGQWLTMMIEKVVGSYGSQPLIKVQVFSK